MPKRRPHRTDTERERHGRATARSTAAGWLSVALLLVLSGCTTLAQSLRNQECTLDPDRPFDVVAIDPAAHDVRLYWQRADDEPFRTLDAVRTHLEAQGDSIIALTNGGIYEPGLIPTGLYVENGEQRTPLNTSDGEGNFFLKPNGVFAVTAAGLRVVETRRYADLQAPIQYATQSGPLLLEDGRIHRGFTRGSTNCRVRSGVGVLEDGRGYLVISNGALNFRSFARYFRDTLGATDALYLDGGISELYAPGLGREATGGEEFAVIVAVIARRE